MRLGQASCSDSRTQKHGRRTTPMALSGRRQTTQYLSTKRPATTGRRDRRDRGGAEWVYFAPHRRTVREVEAAGSWSKPCPKLGCKPHKSTIHGFDCGPITRIGTSLNVSASTNPRGNGWSPSFCPEPLYSPMPPPCAFSTHIEAASATSEQVVPSWTRTAPCPTPRPTSNRSAGSGLAQSLIKVMVDSRLAAKCAWQRAMPGKRRAGRIPAHSLYRPAARTNSASATCTQGPARRS
jgi:hypothetical protein